MLMSDFKFLHRIAFLTPREFLWYLWDRNAQFISFGCCLSLVPLFLGALKNSGLLFGSQVWESKNHRKNFLQNKIDIKQHY